MVCLLMYAPEQRWRGAVVSDAQCYVAIRAGVHEPDVRVRRDGSRTIVQVNPLVFDEASMRKFCDALGVPIEGASEDTPSAG